MRIAHSPIVVGTLLAIGMTACESTEKGPPPTPPQAPASPSAAPASGGSAAPASATAPSSRGPVFTTTQIGDGPLAVEDSVRAEVTARVKAIDLATREVTLEGPSGRSIEFVAGQDIRRLDEVRVGDMVKVEYVASLLAELRPPTADEIANPIDIVDVAGRVAQGGAPAAGAISATRVVTTVEAVDIPNMRIVLRGPLGDLTTVKARNPDNIRKLRVGDTIVIFFTEGVGVSLVKSSGG